MTRWLAIVVGMGLAACGPKTTATSAPGGGPTLKPTPGDADGDGLPNAADQCTTYPEDRDGFEDADGCPDNDNDGDGVRDFEDECPDDPACGEAPDRGDGGGGAEPESDPETEPEPEPEPGDQDADADGIPDGYDGCPDVPEDGGGDYPDDGCPE